MEYVQFETIFGEIVVKIDIDAAPNTAAFFISLVNDKYFDNGHFYRVVHKKKEPDQRPSIGVVQGGVGWDNTEGQKTIALETTEQTGIVHERGVISLAQEIPGVSVAEFFICTDDCSPLDFNGTDGRGKLGYAAFGHVTKGMEIIDKIHNLPANSFPPDGDKRFANEFLDDVIGFKVKMTPSQVEK